MNTTTNTTACITECDGKKEEISSKKKECTSSCEQNNNITQICDMIVCTDDNNEDVSNKCANCGREGNDVVNTCNKCKMVKYCNAVCKKRHRSKHKKNCIGGISDETLFDNPPPKKECDLCTLPMFYSEEVDGVIQSYHHLCCGNIICYGCAIQLLHKISNGDEECCPFCRASIGISSDRISYDNEEIKRCKQRMKVNDSEAFYYLGLSYERGGRGLPRDYNKAFEFWIRAAELGLPKAHFSIANAYYEGIFVSEDHEKMKYHFELAAIGGHEVARHNLGLMDIHLGNIEGAMKHFMLAARSGYEDSMKEISKGCKAGHVTKDEHAITLRQYQTVCDEMKSDQRAQAKLEHDQNIDLFKEPPPKKNCPICFLPMSCVEGLCGASAMYQPCCGVMICSGCVMKMMNEMSEGNIKDCCPCCREPIDYTDKVLLNRCKNRMAVHDAEAFYELGLAYRHGNWGLLQDYNKAFELWTRAAELGSIYASYDLGTLYILNDVNLDGVDEDDMEACIHHWKIAAMGGHEGARHKLGVMENILSNVERAMKHFIIAANSGDDESLKEVGKGFRAGHVTKEKYARTLRSYQDSQNEMKNEEREEASVWNRLGSLSESTRLDLLDFR